jgi:rod shape determining protein RodA
MIFQEIRYLKHFDWITFFITNSLSLIGLLFIFSATYRAELPYSIFFKKQLFGIFGGLIIFVLFSLLDYRVLMRWGYYLYGVVIVLLTFTLIKGKIGMGGQRWLELVFFRLQPSELAKLFFPAFITHYLYQYKDRYQYSSFLLFAPILIVLVVSFMLMRKQPDLGTGLIILCSGLISVWCAGINKKFFIYGFIIIVISMPVSWHTLKQYQKKRILVFLGYGDKNSERYQLEQSKIAIGSGGLFGKGFLQGTQNRFRFLPESRTDFIFSVIAEEMGFFGVLSILLLYAFLFFRLLIIIAMLKDVFVQLLAIGIISPIILSTFINICMVTGLLPIVGIPLPLLSYGLSNLWVTYAALGWLSGITMRRFYIHESISKIKL